MFKSDTSKKGGIEILSKNPYAAQRYQESVRNIFATVHTHGEMEDVENNWKKAKNYKWILV